MTPEIARLSRESLETALCAVDSVWHRQIGLVGEGDDILVTVIYSKFVTRWTECEQRTACRSTDAVVTVAARCLADLGYDTKQIKPAYLRQTFCEGELARLAVSTLIKVGK